VNLPAGPLVVIVGTAIFAAGLVVSCFSKDSGPEGHPQHKYINLNTESDDVTNRHGVASTLYLSTQIIS
jgi:hypothetical protein